MISNQLFIASVVAIPIGRCRMQKNIAIATLFVEIAMQCTPQIKK